MQRRALTLATLSIAACALSTGAMAQKASKTEAWPSKPLRIIVGFPGGSSPDLTARAFAEPLSKALGQPVIVENKVGAAGNIAADAVAKATDNHTIGLMINGNMTIAKLLNPKLSYDPLKDLQPLSLLGVSPLVLTAPANAPGNNAAEFLQAARAAGDRWNYGTPGMGTVGHLGMELLKSQAKIAPVHVPYPGYPQVATAMIAGDLHLSLLPPALANAQIKAGKLKAIGVTASVRSPLAPEIPSLSEAGVKNFNLEIWNAVAAPNSLPPAAAAKLATLLSEIARSPEMRQKMFQQGWTVVGTTAEGLRLRVQSDTALLAGIIASQGIKID
ncbi:tripartite tricarboxylate transporter substrate binding protein [Rhodoferax sp.]|uniref:Bug family tripartite tricarboxylate transporter substrate binding protein n=1 Tax=Rhodoferax sp. TaxID=50421 RepID=UPI002ACEFC01|nr:tripartite tricarboxylate transporter substrate binding protein [Rhodoferax sp.]MDZ7918902.1 tripartite tricarboxylate transporter substrate binding protein [Rhodoferax sp.]